MQLVNYYHETNFLPTDAHASVREFVRDRRNLLSPATVIGDPKSRNGSAAFGVAIAPLTTLIIPPIQRRLADLFVRLAVIPFEPEYDVQLSMYSQGGYFRRHNDSGNPAVSQVARRRISFVYYFKLQPSSLFYGGQLRLWDDQVWDDVIPLNNSAVFFRSELLHEVLPVIVPSREFIDNRFTINGWLLQPEE